jgi:putative SOS response-associated peptidase YedK
MCARVKVSKTAAIQSLLADMGFSSEGLGEHLFEVNKDEQLFPYYKPLATLFVNSQSSMDLALMNWGWQRPWDESKRLFNARKCSAKGQSIWQSKVWGDAIRQRRCLLPIDCFYEWDQNFPRGKRPRYRVEPSQREVMSLGAIYEINQAGEFCLSVCTTEPNSSMQQIHHRMPVMIEPEHAQEWLFSEDQHAIDHLMQPGAEKKIQLICESNSTESSSSQSNDKHDESEAEGRPYTLPLF